MSPADQVSSRLDVSIIIVSFNTSELTRACLESVFEETRRVSFEVIVVDNASVDGSAAMVAEEFPSVRLIASDENLGFGRANNVAAGHASGEHILLLNSDTVVLDGAIDELVAYAEAHPDAGIYGGRSVFGDGSLNPQCCWGRPTLWTELSAAVGLSGLFPDSTLFNPRYLGTWQRDTEREVDVIAGSFLLMSTPLWRRLDGFDPQFFMYGEDIDLCLRGRELGHRCLFTPDAEIIHYGGGSDRVVVDKMVKLLRAKAQLYRKHWSPAAAAIGVRLLDVWTLVRVVGFRLARRADDHRDWTAIWRRRSAWHGAAASEEPSAPTA